MKKLITIICLLTSSMLGFSQGLKFYDGTTDVTGTTITINMMEIKPEYYKGFDIHNTNTYSVSVLTNVVVNTFPIGVSNEIQFVVG